MMDTAAAVRTNTIQLFFDLRVLTLTVIFLAAFLWHPLSAAAGDLDDGISNYTDDPISQLDALGSVEPNVEFIILNAKSRSMVSSGEDIIEGDDSTGNINSVVIGEGAAVYGDIIIVDQSVGDKILTIGASALSDAGVLSDIDSVDGIDLGTDLGL